MKEAKNMNNIQIGQEIRAAIKQGDIERVKALIGSDQTRLNMMTPFGTWLHVAASFGKLEIVKHLVALGTDLNRDGGIGGGAPIKRAASDGHIEVVKYLLSCGAKMDVSESGKSPLVGAIYGGHKDIVKLLVASGIDTKIKYNSQTRKDWDALAFANERGQKEIAALIQGSSEVQPSEPKTPSSQAKRRTVKKKASGKADEEALREWLKHERAELLDALKVAIRKHVAKLKSQRLDLYGYALTPDDACEVTSLGVAWNRAQDVKKDTPYYRFSVDEWGHQDFAALESVSPLFTKLNEQFNQLHPKPTDDDADFVFDEYELAHRQAYHDTLLKALLDLKSEGVFDFPNTDPYLAIWISDSDQKIMEISVKALNSSRIISEYESEFGENVQAGQEK